MGAVKRFYEDCAAAGRCPISRETRYYLDALEARDPAIDWIGYTEHDYRSATGLLVSYDAITLESARRLVAEELADEEIAGFVACFAAS